MFCICVYKDNKVMKTKKKNIGAGPQTSLNIKLSRTVVLLLEGLNGRRDDLPSEQA